MISLLFQKRENRDRVFKLLKAQGKNVRRSSHRGQCLHPMYVEDYEKELSPEEKGFGNTLYKTLFSVLYTIEEKWY